MINFRIVTLKGVIEHNDPEIYFGNKKAVSYWVDEAIKAGYLIYINDVLSVTNVGYALYRDLKLYNLPKEGVAYTWENKEYMNE